MRTDPRCGLWRGALRAMGVPGDTVRRDRRRPGTEGRPGGSPQARWPLPDSSFDVLLCTQVLEHVSDLEHVFSEMVRVSRPGGRLIVSVPFYFNEHDPPLD